MTLQLRDIFKFIDLHSDDEIRNAIESENFSGLTLLPPRIQSFVASNPDIWNDIWWNIMIRNNAKVEEFPCVHIAYATSAETGHLITESNGVFSIMIDERRSKGIVIAHCPWCAAALNTNALLNV